MADSLPKTDLPRATLIGRALDVFTHGFAHGRSFTHPYVVAKIGKLWVTRDAPRKNPRDYRREEWFAFEVDPHQVDSTARKQTRGRFAVCAIRAMDDDSESMRTAYKSMGYRLGTTEPIFIHDLARIPAVKASVSIERVKTEARAEDLRKAAGRRQILPEHLVAGAPVRQYIAVDGNQIVGWVKSITVGEMTWCSNMYVQEAHRRRGIAKALLARMLRDDRVLGMKANVLASSHTGALLYPKMGYRQIAELLLFTPRRG